LKLSRQCPLLLLVGARLIDSKLLGNEEGKRLGAGFVVSRPKNLRWSFTAYDQNFDINFGTAGLE
jgi:hypothetical protein